MIYYKYNLYRIADNLIALFENLYSSGSSSVVLLYNQYNRYNYIT